MEVVLNEGLQKIGNGAFDECKWLQTVTIPSTVIEVGNDAFWKCNNLREVGLPDGLQKIESYTFADCTSLQSITFPSTLTEIGKYSFHSCSNWEVRLPDGLQEMGRNAFASCLSLERFKFPRLSTRMKAIINLGSIETENKIDELLRFEILQRLDDDELFISAAAMDKGNNWATIKPSLDRTIKLITYYETKEATTLFELALWKAKIDQADGSILESREGCRIEVPGPVKEAILQYL